MSRTSHARLATLLAPLMAGSLLSGCGSSAPADPEASPSPSAPAVMLSEVSAATSGAGTARVQVRTEATAGSAGSGASFNSTGTLEGVVDFASGDAQLVTELPTGGQLESRSVDGVQYTRLPAAAGGDQGKPWLKIDLPGGGGAALGGLTDPTGGLSLLRDAGGPLTEVGRERVRDADTVRYRTELDLAKLPAPSPTLGASGAPAPDAAGLLRRLLGDKPLPVEVWVDDQQRIRRLTLVLPIGDLGGASRQPTASGQPAASPSSAPGIDGGTSTSTTEYFDFGVAVDVQPPPADEVRAVPRRVPLPGGATRAPSPSPTS